MAELTAETLRDLLPEADPRDPRASGLLQPLDEVVPLPAGSPVLAGLPYDGGVPSRPGARFGPAALRNALSAFTTWSGGRDLPALADAGDLSLPQMNAADVHSRVETAATRLFSAGVFPLFAGGDHGLTGSVLLGLAAARPGAVLGLITIDAHLDVREYSGQAHLSSGTPFRRALELEALDGSRTVMIGLRPFANSGFYTNWVLARGVTLFSVDDVAGRGAEAIAAQALAVVAGADTVYLSIDMDAADAAFAPGASAAGPGGLTSREMISLVRALGRGGNLAGADLMELSPPYDIDARSAKLGARLLLELLAARTAASAAPTILARK